MVDISVFLLYATTGDGPYCYMDDLLHFETCEPVGASPIPPQMREVETPLRWRAWDHMLEDHPDQRFRSYVVRGIRRGFRVGFHHECQLSKSNQNMSSATDHSEVIQEYLAEECSEGRVLGPLDPDLFPFVQVSRFGVIPKGSTGKWRLIVDLSAPLGASVNDGIDEHRCSLSYATVWDAAREISERGAGTLMAKIDVKQAYRNIPVHPDDRVLMGMKWNGKLFIDTALPFGLRSAPKIFNAVADAVEWILHRQGVKCVLHYLDDFLIIGRPGTEECSGGLATLLNIFERLGLPVATHKQEGPAESLTFLGFQLDSLAMEVRLPQDKLVEILGIARQWLGKKGCRRSELESLVGKLAHASTVVRPGKTFMRRMFELLAGIRKAHHHIRLGQSFRSDILWWVTFMEEWNGVALIPGHRRPRPSHHVWSDASGSVGCGAFDPASHQWFQLKWRQSREGLGEGIDSILALELLPIVIACVIWGPRWRHSVVTAHCDNEGAVAVINAGYSRVPRIMHLLRCLFFIRAHFEISLGAVHVPGFQNTWADAISRDNIQYFLLQVPGAARGQRKVPDELVHLLVDQQPDWTSPTWTQLFRNSLQLV